MILCITFSKPAKDCAAVLGKPYVRIRIRKMPQSALRKAGPDYSAEYFTEKQSFHKTLSASELDAFIEAHAGKTFRNVVERTETEEITFLANRHGEVKVLRKKLSSTQAMQEPADGVKKNYILKEGIPVPFLVKLGVMTESGKVIASKYDKFRQINRFLEFISDIVPAVQKLTEAGTFTQERPLRIADFGCGKSYLTFAVYYYLKELQGIPVEITGLDLKEDVIAECQRLAKEFRYDGLHFYIGNIADFSYKAEQDIIITLHACDTATDYALNYAIRHNAKAILSVPCCQHEVNLQLESRKADCKNDSPYASLERYGLIRERFAALATDALRAELLEQQGYSVQILEFIDMTHTPKNLLIRAVKKNTENGKAAADKDKCTALSRERSNVLLSQLQVSQTLHELLQG